MMQDVSEQLGATQAPECGGSSPLNPDYKKHQQI